MKSPNGGPWSSTVMDFGGDSKRALTQLCDSLLEEEARPHGSPLRESGSLKVGPGMRSHVYIGS